MKNAKSLTIQIGQLKDSSAILPVSYPLSSPQLLDSLRNIGLITPLFVQGVSSGKYQVICGHRRLFACRQLGWDSVSCQVLDESLNDLNLLLFNLHDNRSSRTFNPVEQSLIIKQLEKFMPADKVVNEYLPFLGLRPHDKVRDKLLPLADLDENIKDAVLEGRVHPDVAYSLSCLSNSDCKAIFVLLENVHLSTSKQQELITNLEALAFRENTSIEKLIAESAVQNICQDEELQLNQKGAEIRQLIHKRRMPLFSKAQQDFLNYKKELGLPPNIHLTPPPFFENDQYKVSFSFKNPEELKQKLDKLNKMADTTAIRQIMDIGKRT